MNKAFYYFIGIGCLLIVSGVLYLLFNMNDRSVIFALPVILLGTSIIAVYLFIVDKTKTMQ
jgi:Ca2+/Na+ antiporter